MKGKKKLILLGLDAVSLPLIERFAEEGSLPHLRRLMEDGSANKALSCIPAYTPNNWATIATGAWPGTHGAGNWYDNKPGDPEDRQPLSTFDSRAITAQTIWEAGEKAGMRSLVIGYPGSYPSRLKEGLIVAPLNRGLASLVMVGGCVYSPEAEPGRPARIEIGPASGWEGVDADSCLEAEIRVGHPPSQQMHGPLAAKRAGDTEDGAELEATVKDRAQTEAPAEIRFQLLIQKSSNGYDRVLLCQGKDASNPLAELKVGQWSPWIIRRLQYAGDSVPASMRFKLVELSPDGKRMRLARSEVYPAERFTEPESLSDELVSAIGPYIEHASGNWRDPIDRETNWEEMEYQVDWHVQAAKHLMQKPGWQIYYSHWHLPDSIEHSFLAPADPAAPGYDPERAEEAISVLRRCHQLCDRMVAGFRELADENTYLVVVSDHGNSSNMYQCNMPRRLQEAGLLALDAEGETDWTYTRAYVLGGTGVCVNLKGREPQGIVDPADYEKVQEEIIDALLDWREPTTGRRAIALALKRKDAQLLGYWGPRLGDVFFTYNAGFSWGATEQDQTISIARGTANHGPQIPTAETEFSSNLATFIIAGPGVKSGYRRDPERLGYVRLVDLVPTFCHLLDIASPAHAQGCVLWDLLE